MQSSQMTLTHDQQVDVIIDTLLDVEWYFLEIYQIHHQKRKYVSHFTTIDDNEVGYTTLCNRHLTGAFYDQPCIPRVIRVKVTTVCPKCIRKIRANPHRFDSWHIRKEIAEEFENMGVTRAGRRIQMARKVHYYIIENLKAGEKVL